MGVGSLVEETANSALEYILDLCLPYAFQRPSNPDEDMIRQFGALLPGFEEKGTFIYDPDFDSFQDILQNEEGLVPNERYFGSLYELKNHVPFKFLKVQATAPATMCYSIRGDDGRQHLTPQMFKFYTSLVARIVRGYVQFFNGDVEQLIVCQDDPSFGFVTEAINAGNVPGLSAHHIMKITDQLYPKEIIPAYHYCYDWRVLTEDDTHLIWQSKPKIAHLDMITYPPEVDASQAELINKFLESGGAIALGVLPNVDDAYSESVISYFEKSLKAAISLLIESGVNINLLEENSMVSTQCGLSGASPKLSRIIHEHDKEYPEILKRTCAEFR